MKISLAESSPLSQPDFTYGVATAAFQIEGAADSRRPCIWDTFCAMPDKIKDSSDGLVACDHFNRWQQDLALIESLEVDAYRFSISWPRVMTQSGELDPQGVAFYIQLLDALNQKNIKPYVTLYHWDLPQHLEDKGGWLNRETAYHFRDYVDLITQAFGDRVFSYSTLNEPFCSAYLGYELGIHAPGLKSKAYGKQAAHHLLLAHGLGMQVLAKNSPNTLNGIVLNVSPCYPKTDSEKDKDAAWAADQNLNHWYAMPVLEGRYPESINTLPKEELPPIKEGDMGIICQPLDYIGLENGAAMADTYADGQVQDTDRIEYFQGHLQAVSDAAEQGVDIRGYFAWSLMDNFEWAEGYEKRFGIVYVDYETQQRTIKASGLAYRDFISSRHLAKSA